MDSRYRFSANMPHRYEQVPNNHPNPISSRYLHRAPLIFPPQQQQSLNLRHSPAPSPSPLFSSSYLGPLPHHRPRFLSSWDLAPTPTIYLSSRNIAGTPPTPIPSSKSHEHGASILNSCPSFSLACNWLRVLKRCIHSRRMPVSVEFSQNDSLESRGTGGSIGV